MTKPEIDIIKRALDLLHQLVPDDELRAGDLKPRRCQVMAFAKRYLMDDPASDVSTAELWQFFGEVAASGEVQPLSKSEFLRRLPGVMAAVFGVRKAHDIERDGQRVRGFRRVGFWADTNQPLAVVLEPE